MALRPARIYRKVPGQPYTRISFKTGKSFIAGAPSPKINIFESGDKDSVYNRRLSLVIKKDCCIRSNALEAMRIAANSYLEKNVMGKKFYLKVEVYPHHVIRYHPTAGVAQADRYYQGMSKPFGRPDARAAILKENQEVLNVYINDENLSKAKEALRRAARKLPVPTKIVVE